MRVGQYPRLQAEDNSAEHWRRYGDGNSPHDAFCADNCCANGHATHPDDAHKDPLAARVRSASFCSHQSNKENDYSRQSSTLNTRSRLSAETNQVELMATEPVDRTCRPLASSDGGQQARVSFASIPVLCAHPDDRFGDNSYSNFEVHMRPSREHQPTPGRGIIVNESSRNIALSDGHSAITTQRCSISSNSTNIEANRISLTESVASPKMQSGRLSSTPASAINKTHYTHAAFDRKKAPLFSRRAIDFSHAKELASSTPQQTGNATRDEKETCGIPSTESLTRDLSLVNGGSSRLATLSMQMGPTQSNSHRCQVQSIEPAKSSVNSSSLVYRTRFGEEIVTQPPEVKQRAAHLVNNMLQQRMNSSSALNSTSSPIRPFTNRVVGSCSTSSWDHFTHQQNQTNNSHQHGNTMMPKVSEMVINLKCSDPSSQSSELSTVRSLEVKKGGAPREVRGRMVSVTSDGRSTIRDRVPRGQTRRLASMFETMTEEAVAEMTNERSRLQANASMRRNRSLPPQKATRHDHEEHSACTALGKGSLDDSFLVERECDNGEGGRYISEVIFRTNRLRETIGDKSIRDQQPNESLQTTQYVEVAATPDARAIDTRFDTFATTKRYFESQIAATTHRDSPSISSTSEVRVQAPSMTREDTDNKVDLGSRVFVDRIDHEGMETVGRLSEPIKPPRAFCRDDAYSMPAEMNGVFSHNTKTVRLYQTEMHKFRGKYDIVHASSGESIHDGEGECGHVYTTNSHINALTLRSTAHTGNLYGRNSERLTPHDCLCKERTARGGHEPYCDVVDNIAEVNKAFAFVDEEESFVDEADARHSRGGTAAHGSANKPLGYSISMYRELARGHRHSPTDDVPVHFSAATFNMPSSAGKQAAACGRMESGDVVRSKKDSVTSNPLATSTPLEGSPASAMRSICGSTDHALNSTGISAITVSTVCGNSYEQDYATQIKRLNDAILVQEERLSQADAALTHAKKFSNFNGTLAELCIHREVLLCRERHSALRRELERVKMMHTAKKRIPELSSRTRNTFDVSSITIFLNRNFCIRNIDEGNSYAFVALLKAGEQVYATEAITLMDSRVMRVSSVKFNEPIRCTNLPVDLTITLEIYALKVHEMRGRVVDDRSCAKLRNRARTLLSPLRKPNVDTSVVSSSQFTFCGSVVLNRETVGTQRFYLDNAEYPLEGTVEVRSSCAALPPIIETTFRGFLTMYEVISGFGSWARYWAVMRRGVVYFWKYPDDEATEKPVLAYMDLASCVDKKIELAAFEVCSRPHTFSVELLIPTSSRAVENKRVLLSADTKEQCIAWIDAINETLDILRT